MWGKRSGWRQTHALSVLTLICRGTLSLYSAATSLVDLDGARSHAAGSTGMTTLFLQQEEVLRICIGMLSYRTLDHLQPWPLCFPEPLYFSITLAYVDYLWCCCVIRSMICSSHLLHNCCCTRMMLNHVLYAFTLTRVDELVCIFITTCTCRLPAPS